MSPARGTAAASSNERCSGFSNTCFFTGLVCLGEEFDDKFTCELDDKLFYYFSTSFESQYLSKIGLRTIRNWENLSKDKKAWSKLKKQNWGIPTSLKISLGLEQGIF